MKRFCLMLALCCAYASAATVPVVSARASAESELEVLARLEAELTLLGPLIREAEAAGGSGRLAFDYAQLRVDLDRIKLGIRAYRAGELTEPKQIEPITGEYRR